MKRLFFLILVTFCSLIADAKCILVEYEIKGFISDVTNMPIQNARIRIEWVEVEDFIRAAETSTDKNGEFALLFHYYPWSKTNWQGTDICDSVLKEINFIIKAEGFEHYRSVYVLGSHKSSANITLKRKTERNPELP